jgi:hypothetical protein
MNVRGRIGPQLRSQEFQRLSFVVVRLHRGSPSGQHSQNHPRLTARAPGTLYTSNAA